MAKKNRPNPIRFLKSFLTLLVTHDFKDEKRIPFGLLLTLTVTLLSIIFSNHQDVFQENSRSMSEVMKISYRYHAETYSNPNKTRQLCPKIPDFHKGKRDSLSGSPNNKRKLYLFYVDNSGSMEKAEKGHHTSKVREKLINSLKELNDSLKIDTKVEYKLRHLVAAFCLSSIDSSGKSDNITFEMRNYVHLAGEDRFSEPWQNIESSMLRREYVEKYLSLSLEETNGNNARYTNFIEWFGKIKTDLQNRLDEASKDFNQVSIVLISDFIQDAEDTYFNERRARAYIQMELDEIKSKLAQKGMEIDNLDFKSLILVHENGNILLENLQANFAMNDYSEVFTDMVFTDILAKRTYFPYDLLVHERFLCNERIEIPYNFYVNEELKFSLDSIFNHVTALNGGAINNKKTQYGIVVKTRPSDSKKDWIDFRILHTVVGDSVGDSTRISKTLFVNKTAVDIKTFQKGSILAIRGKEPHKPYPVCIEFIPDNPELKRICYEVVFQRVVKDKLSIVIYYSLVFCLICLIPLAVLNASHKEVKDNSYTKATAKEGDSICPTLLIFLLVPVIYAIGIWYEDSWIYISILAVVSLILCLIFSKGGYYFYNLFLVFITVLFTKLACIIFHIEADFFREFFGKGLVDKSALRVWMQAIIGGLAIITLLYILCDVVYNTLEKYNQNGRIRENFRQFSVRTKKLWDKLYNQLFGYARKTLSRMIRGAKELVSNITNRG